MSGDAILPLSLPTCEPLDRSKLKPNEVRDLTIIEAVKKHRCIWDCSHPDRQDDAKVTEAWELVRADIKFRIPFCKLRWKKVRDRLRFRMKQGMSKSTNENEMLKYISSVWPLYPAIEFLFSDRGSNNIRAIWDDVFTELCSVDDYESNMANRSPNTNINADLPGEDDSDYSSLVPPHIRLDEDYLFLMSRLKEIKSLPPKKRMKLRIAIQKVICDSLAELE